MKTAISRRALLSYAYLELSYPSFLLIVVIIRSMIDIIWEKLLTLCSTCTYLSILIITINNTLSDSYIQSALLVSVLQISFV